MRILSLLSILFIALGLKANTAIPYNIKGAVSSPEKSKIAYLYIHSAGKKYPSQLLSAPIVNGRFTFSGITQPDSLGIAMGVLFFHTKPGLTKKEYLALYQQGLKFKYRKVALEKQVTVNVASTLDLATVEGDLMNEQQNELQRIRQMEIDDFDKLKAWWNEQEAAIKGDKEAMVKLKADYFNGLRANEDRKNDAYFNFIKTYPSSPLSYQYLKVFVLMSERSLDDFREDLKACMASLPAEVKEKPAIAKLITEANNKIGYAGKLATGTTIPDHTFTAEGVAPVSIKDFRGKYLLLDFWTSWCGPCRAEHYNMKQLYTQYKDKNFTILQVSLDDKDAKWRKALEEDNLPWTQVRCLKGWDKEIEARYDIKGVPTTYLIDPEGKIIARGIRGEALTKKLAELMP
ncbi:MAG: TlpA family protein disulfide reductase [Niastella sp.]|nr:TlpA family protein disulfide reductase [Niastella sp.]